MHSSLRTTLALFASSFTLSLGIGAAGCASEVAPPAPLASDESESSELAAADIDPAAEPIVDEEELRLDADDDVDVASYEGEVDDAPLDESDETEEPAIDTLSLSPLVATPTGEAINGMKPRHCRVNGEVMKSCMCFFSPLNCQLPTTQRGRNRILPKKLYAEMVQRTDAARARGVSARLPVDHVNPWRIAPGTKLYDGNGVVRGTIKEKYGSGKLANECGGYEGTNGYEPVGQGGTCTKINFGLKKKMGVENDATMVYAFAVATDGAGVASGWVPLSAIAESQRDELRAMRTVAGKRIETSKLAPTSYVLKSYAEYGKTLPRWTEGKVIKPKTTCTALRATEKNGKVGDYIVRDNGTWNLAYNTPGPGGISVDTFVVAKDALGFRRVRSTRARPTLVRVKVYCSSLESMVFAYGAVVTKSGLRFGWAPLRALRTGAPVASAAAATPTAPSGEGMPSNQSVPEGFCAGKADGFHCLGIGDDAVAARCEAGAPTAAVECDARLRCIGPNATNTNVTCGAR
ncbi:MAG: hypothetical protein JST00_09655 [Deltaproteobacteria bacterium]|nr:hypothetical protein [Deltaproteobacteria bacterium]